MQDESVCSRIYRGFIAEHDLGEAMDVLFLTGIKEPLAEAIENDIDSHGRFLTVLYFITDQEQSPEELNENLIRQVVGAGDAEYRSHYSEITGYLWTDENFMIGGHNLLEELRSHKGKFAHLEIVYSREPLA